jgi:hypothetical protein
VKTRLTLHERQTYLAYKKTLVLHRLRQLLADLTPEDMAALAPGDRMTFAAVLDRMPDEIPSDLIASLRAALTAAEVAA